MNYVDILIGIILLFGVIFGAIRGGGKQMVGIVSLWLSLIVSLWLYDPLSDKILAGIFEGASKVVLDSFSFVMLMIFFTGAVQIIFIISSTAPEEKLQKTSKKIDDLMEEAEKGGSAGSVLNAIAGLITGFIVTILWLSISVALVRYIVFNSNVSPNLRYSMQTSNLLQYTNQVLEWLFLSIKYFIPREAAAFIGRLLV